MEECMQEKDILKELIQLSLEVGKEERALSILGEGNTSAAIGDGTFWVKSSGCQLGKADERSFSRVSLDYVLKLMEAESLSDERIEEELVNSLIDKSHRKPSVETFLHAFCLAEVGVKWVAHAHPVSVNSILCSKLGAKPFLESLFPDGIVVCGAKPAVLPYIDPGYALSKAFRATLQTFIKENGKAPKIVLMENHGVVALGETAQEALNIQLMTDKWARIILGTYTLGGPRPMTPANVERIDNRLDEEYRRQLLAPK
jgi:rhamnose utilization protein RhaD (predicted bifunctional aldolase and dehydrogenase)